MIPATMCPSGRNANGRHEQTNSASGPARAIIVPEARTWVKKKSLSLWTRREYSAGADAPIWSHGGALANDGYAMRLSEQRSEHVR
jgi:hypothetical protein